MEYYLFAGNHLHLYPVQCKWLGIRGQDCEFSLDTSVEYNGSLDPKILQKACQVRLADLEKIVKELESAIKADIFRLQILLIPV